VVRGKISYTAYSRDQSDAPISRITLDFVGRFSGCQWNIKTAPSLSDQDSNKPPIIEYSEVGSDGTSVFSFDSYRSIGGIDYIVTTNRMGNIVTNNIVRGFGQAYRGPVPIADFSHAHPIWFAFGSHCYLDSRSDGRLKPLWMVPERASHDERFLKKAVIHRHSRFPKLPVMVDFHNDGSTFSEAPDGTLRRIRYQEPYDNGFLVATFRAAGFVRAGHWSIPTTFELTVNSPAHGGVTPDDLWKRVEWSAVVEDFEILPASGLYVPKAGKQMAVRDFRAMSKAPIQYLTENEWLDPSDSLFEQLETNYSQVYGHKSRIGYRQVAQSAIVFLVFGAVLVFVVFAVNNNRRMKERKLQ
jgi:hypothetical protein